MKITLIPLKDKKSCGACGFTETMGTDREFCPVCRQELKIIVELKK